MNRSSYGTPRSPGDQALGATAVSVSARGSASSFMYSPVTFSSRRSLVTQRNAPRAPVTSSPPCVPRLQPVSLLGGVTGRLPAIEG